MPESKSNGRAVVVGGSIAGVSAVHALLSAGWEVVVLEKTTAPPTGSPTGAGLGLDPLSQSIIKSWLPRHQVDNNILNTHTLPLTIDLDEAEKTWVPELVRVIKETKEPFLNVIYDCDPLHRIVWDRVVLIGDAAHPTTPHGVRSTNMSILHAAVLGQCLMKSGVENLAMGLEEYQSIRVPVTSKQVLHSRKMGRIKQGLVLADGKVFDPKTATPEECRDLQQKYMPGLNGVP